MSKNMMAVTRGGIYMNFVNWGLAMIEAINRVEGMLVISMENEAGMAAERLAASQSVKVQDVLLALLRMYAADARIGDDQRIGTGAFADSVDAEVLKLTFLQPETGWGAMFLSEAEGALADCLDAHSYSRFNRGLGSSENMDESPFFVNARLGALAQSCIQACRKSDKYRNILLGLLNGDAGFVEEKEIWWGKWQTMKKKSDTPTKMQKYFMRLYVEKLLELPEESLDAILDSRDPLFEAYESSLGSLEQASAELDKMLDAEQESGPSEESSASEELAFSWSRYFSAALATVSADDEQTFISNRLERYHELNASLKDTDASHAEA